MIRHIGIRLGPCQEAKDGAWGHEIGEPPIERQAVALHEEGADRITGATEGGR